MHTYRIAFILIFPNIYNEEKRNSLITAMAEAGIATNVHFKPLPMHTACIVYYAVSFFLTERLLPS